MSNQLCIFHSQKQTFLITAKDNDKILSEKTDPILACALLFGCGPVGTDSNTQVLNASIDYIISTMKFEKPHFLCCRDFVI